MLPVLHSMYARSGCWRQAPLDLDNLHLADMGPAPALEAGYELEALLLTGSCIDIAASSRNQVPRLLTTLPLHNPVSVLGVCGALLACKPDKMLHLLMSYRSCTKLSLTFAAMAKPLICTQRSKPVCMSNTQPLVKVHMDTAVRIIRGLPHA